MHAITTPNGSAARQAARVRGSERAATTRIAAANSERRNVTPRGVECANARNCDGPAELHRERARDHRERRRQRGHARAARMTCAGLDMAVNIAAGHVRSGAPPTCRE